MTEQTLAQIRAHAQQEAPRECCGLLIVRKGKERYWPCRNLAAGADHFHLDPHDATAAEDEGDVLAIVHSHVQQNPLPSQADLVACEASGVPWIIVSWPTGEVYEFTPTGYVAPLIGRVFTHGTLDCYAIIRDYYQQTLHIALPDFERLDDWWKTDQDLYRDNFRAAGFTPIDAAGLRLHDVILMQLSANKTNHGAIYLGEGKILHHPMNRLSGRDVYGGYWQTISTVFLRHKDLA